MLRQWYLLAYHASFFQLPSHQLLFIIMERYMIESFLVNYLASFFREISDKVLTGCYLSILAFTSLSVQIVDPRSVLLCFFLLSNDSKITLK